ncbi:MULTISPECIES: helix-turn-helix domain-containing protein [unclassified Sporolactobacillus]|uniref:helix-turn-helix domain-containing protein n=1 Tax=unclassified Sporolactobacillus TaxID=2628533 RepID=UPI0023681925|nr:AraC family transcriptional regulator [Sporolactobacillus sp. CQH2019]MDD9148793.1 AraC family transcriptional regulator [Sporolactobacillus sp. CQH2019]
MNIDRLYFQLHYCKEWKRTSMRKKSGGVSRILTHHEFIFFVRGEGSFAIDRKSYPVHHETLLYVPAHTLQSFRINGPVDCITVHFSYAVISTCDNQWEIHKEDGPLPFPPVQQMANSRHVERHFRRLFDCWTKKMPQFECQSLIYFQQLLLDLYQTPDQQSMNQRLKIKSAIHYMHQKIDQKITLGELAQFVHTSPAYLSRIFKRMTGYTVIAFFNQIKINKAKEMLIEEDKKIKEIALDLGFVDEFYFSRVFKQLEGVSPTEYKDKNVHDL